MGEKFVKTLIRFGFIIRGILYLLTGFYGIEAAIGFSSGAKDTTQIIEILGRIPFGRTILSIIFIGLIGYGLGGILRAWFGKYKPLIRLGYLSSGLAYLGVSLIPLQLLMNLAPMGGAASKKYLVILSGLPGGYWVISLVGLATMLAGFNQIKYGYDEKFKNNLKKMESGGKKETVELAGKYGYVARGVVISLVGFFLFLAGITGDIFKIKGPTEILKWTWQQSQGALLLGVISGGLMALGAYSIMAAGIVKLKVGEKN